MLLALLTNKLVSIKRINLPDIIKQGDIHFDGFSFSVMFLWRKRLLALTELERIRVYSTVDWGLENVYVNVDVEFTDGSKLLFDGSNEDHRNLIDSILINMKASLSDWNFTFTDSYNKHGEDVLYQKKNSYNQ